MDGSEAIIAVEKRGTAAWPAERPAMDGRAAIWSGLRDAMDGSGEFIAEVLRAGG